jgi:hypothetical protein
MEAANEIGRFTRLLLWHSDEMGLKMVHSTAFRRTYVDVDLSVFPNIAVCSSRHGPPRYLHSSNPSTKMERGSNSLNRFRCNASAADRETLF